MGAHKTAVGGIPDSGHKPTPRARGHDRDAQCKAARPGDVLYDGKSAYAVALDRGVLSYRLGYRIERDGKRVEQTYVVGQYPDTTLAALLGVDG